MIPVKINFPELFFLIFLTSLIISCGRKEIKYEYFDSNNKNIKTATEYKDGKLNGFMVTYYENGKLLEVSEWKDDQRDGLTFSFYPNGDTSAVYNFAQGKAFGEYKIFYENNRLETVSFVTHDGFTINTKKFKIDGSMFPMEPFVQVNSQTIKLGDTIKLRGTMDNIQVDTFMSGWMIVGKGVIENNKAFLSDTLATTFSYFNDYALNFVPETRGENRFIIQFAFRFKEKADIDSIALFSRKAFVIVE